MTHEYPAGRTSYRPSGSPSQAPLFTRHSQWGETVPRARAVVSCAEIRRSERATDPQEPGLSGFAAHAIAARVVSATLVRAGSPVPPSPAVASGYGSSSHRRQPIGVLSRRMDVSR
jgi:hypothetical protein